MKLFKTLVFLFSLIAFLCLHNNANAGGFQKIEYLSGLAVSTDVDFTPDGRMLVAEKAGRIRVVQNGQLLAAPMLDISGHVNNFGDRGLLSIAVDPDFGTNGYIYLLYTYQSPSTPNDGSKNARLVRIQVDPLANVASQPINPPETILLGSIDVPYGDGSTACQPGTDCISTDSSSHTVGEVIFASDKSIFVSVGDGSDFNAVDINALRAQNLDWMMGKVLHINRSGQGLITNPFYNGDPNAPRSKVYQYGLRNPFRISYDQEFGLYVTDTGWNLWEEVNRGPAGANFGWPCYEGNDQQPLYSINALTSIQCQQIYAQNNHVLPLFSYSHQGTGAAIAGGVIYRGSSYPTSYQNNYYYADYNDMYLRRLVLDQNGGYVSDNEFINDVLGPINVFTFPDGDIGAIYVWGGKIYKFIFDPTNRVPVAVAKADKQSGGTPLTVNFDGSESNDLDVDTTLTYHWDFGDGTTADTMNATHTYTVANMYTASLTVSDGLATNTATLQIHVGNHAPVPTITSPKSGEGFVDPLDLHFTGTATDEEDGALAPTKLSWNLVLHHNEHEHLLIDSQQGTGGDVHLDYHGENTYYELRLTATDSNGLSAMTSNIFYVYPKNNVCAAGSNCLGLWNLNTNANDSSEALSHGVISGGVVCSPNTVGHIGGACTFAGTGGKIALPAKNLTNFTFNLWVKPQDSQNIQVLASNKNSGFTQNGFGLFLNAWQTNNRQIIFEVGDGTAGQHIASAPGVATSNEWQMLTVVVNGAEVVLYRNGVEIARQNANPAFLKNAAMYLGAYANDEFSFKGDIDEVGLWGRAFAQGEINALYISALVCQPAPKLGSIKFGLREYSSANTWTGNYLNGITVKLTDLAGTTVYQTTTSSTIGAQSGRVEFKNVPIGNYGIMAYKQGYIGVWKQTTCAGAGTTTGATIQNTTSENNVATWQNPVAVTENATTWCQDTGLKLAPVPQDFGEIKFGVREYNASGQWTGGFVNGATVKLVSNDGATVLGTTTSATVGTQAGRASFKNIPVGTYGIIAYKAGYTGVWKQTTCAGAGTIVGATLQNANTEGFTAAWSNNINIVKDTITWCKDIGIGITTAPASVEVPASTQSATQTQ